MLTNALKFIKYNFFKFLFIIILLFIFLSAVFFFSISYKPLNVNLILKYIGEESLNDIVPSENLENAELQFNLLENVLSINFYGMKTTSLRMINLGSKLILLKQKRLISV